MAVETESLTNSSLSGQATTEYILLIGAVVSIFMVVSGMIGKMALPQKLSQAVMGPFATVYQYGHPDVKWFQNGGPSMHPRVGEGGNFRIFLESQAIK